MVIFDNELTPAQLRTWKRRSAEGRRPDAAHPRHLCAPRAHSKGKLQVELAQLKYLLPRLVGSGVALSRLGGGIGTRGPGETKLETDRRRIRTASATLQRSRTCGAALPAAREAAQGPDPDGGARRLHQRRKDDALQRLTGDQAVASDALFVTLDPLVRKVRLPDSRELLVSDTVGLIDRLPHALVAAFRATLEEVAASTC